MKKLDDRNINKNQKALNFQEKIKIVLHKNNEFNQNNLNNNDLNDNNINNKDNNISIEEEI